MALITKLNNIAQAIGNKTGEPASTYTLDNMPSAIASIQTAWPVVPEPDVTKIVRFIDYDGTVVTQMTLDEAKELTSLPELPTHEGLTGARWTHSLDTIQSANHSLDVGAVYRNAVNPDQTVFFMLPRVNEVVTLNFYQSVANGVTIDWGDGSATETVAGEGDVTATHTYTTVNVSDTPLKLTFTPDNGVDTTLGWGTLAKNMFNNGSSGYSTVVEAILGNSEIGNYAFSYCHALSPIVIPDSISGIGSSAFQYCYSLSSVVIPDSVTSIGNNAFYNCSSLYSVVIPDSVTSIQTYVFQNCISLSSVIIPDSMSTIVMGMFRDCCALSSVVIPDSVTSIGSQAFSSCYSLSPIVIPDSVTSIDSSAFSGCYSLTSIVIPDSVKTIQGQAFSNCYSLTSIVIPDSVSGGLQNGTFGYCYSLSSVVIPDSVTSINNGAFQSCHSLSSIKFADRTTMPTGSGWVFTTSGHNPEIIDCSEFTQVPTVTSSFLSNMPAYTRILVPASLEADWKAATNWSTYASQIVGVE